MTKIQFSIRTLNLCTILLILSFSAFAQTKRTVPTKKSVETNKVVETPKTAERPVRVILKEGEPVNGTFVNSSNEGIQIVIAGNTLTIKWDSISQIVFTDIPQNEVVTKVDDKAIKEKEAVKNALRSLRKIVAATEVGVNFQEYSRRLIDVKTELDEYLPEIPEGKTRIEIQLAMDAYTDAGTAWNGYIQDPTFYGASNRGQLLLKKYFSVTDGTDRCIFERGCVINTIWAKARKHFENASESKSENR